MILKNAHPCLLHGCHLLGWLLHRPGQQSRTLDKCDSAVTAYFLQHWAALHQELGQELEVRAQESKLTSAYELTTID
jgi:hypothetical protein